MHLHLVKVSNEHSNVSQLEHGNVSQLEHGNVSQLEQQGQHEGVEKSAAWAPAHAWTECKSSASFAAVGVVPR